MLKTELKKIVYTLIGAVLLAVGTGWILYAGEYKLYSVGLTGTLQVVQLAAAKLGINTTGVLWNLGTLYMVFNIPLLLIAHKHIGKKFTYYSILSIVVQSLILLLPSPLAGQGFFGLGMLEIAITGGIFVGVGVGLSLKVGSSTGGFDILFTLLAMKTKFSFDTLNFYINAVIILFVVALTDFNWAIGIMTFIRLFISVVSTQATNRNYMLVSLTIFTSKSDEVSEMILKEIYRGVTIYNKIGAYTKQEGKTLFAVMNRYEMKHCKKLIERIDPTAMIIVTRVESISGNFVKKVVA